MACGRQKVKGGHGSIPASSSASSSASIITLNLGVGCAPSCCPIFGFRTSWVLAGGAEGSFLCSLSSRFSGRGAGWGASPGPGGQVRCQGAYAKEKIKTARISVSILACLCTVVIPDQPFILLF